VSPSRDTTAAALAPTNSLSDAVASAMTEGGFDVVFPLLHGPYGEDGSVQGLLKVMGVPFVGTDVLGSAIGMDKLTMKAVFAAAGLPQVRHAAVTRHAYTADPDAALAGLSRLELPLFVKPANLGSSIGITRVEDSAELAVAIEVALGFDRRVIVEEAAVGARELEVAVLGNDRPHASPVGEIRYQAGFYDYQAKYTDGRAQLVIPADVPTAVADAARDLALRAFAVIDAAGLARVDMFYLPDGRLLLNEINTMPGFTRHSMYPKLWEAAGVSYADLVTKLVDLALERR
jgi:D-alanine-D-alanine ligase